MPLLAQAGSASDADRAERATQLAERIQEQADLPGLQAAVLVDGGIVWSIGTGFANVEHSVPITEHTRMRIGSISKTLTAAAIGLLYEAGRLDLDAPVQTYVPSFPKKAHPLTTRQLAGHISGMPHYAPAEFVNTRHYSSITEALDKFKDKELLFAPGERFEYSSYGWNLIGAVIEGAAEQPFLEYMQEKVFEPLGLEDTRPEKSSPVIPRRAQTYVINKSGIYNTPAIDPSDAWPSGGFLSSSENLVRFADAMWSGKLISAETIDLFRRSQRTRDGKETGYGIGWQDQTILGRRWSGHGGSHVGATADLWFQPEEKVAIALITNTNTSALQELLQGLVEIYVGTQ